MIAAATAAALEAARKRQEEEERLRAEIARKNAEAEAREAEIQKNVSLAWLAAIAAAAMAAAAESGRRTPDQRKVQALEEVEHTRRRAGGPLVSPGTPAEETATRAATTRPRQETARGLRQDGQQQTVRARLDEPITDAGQATVTPEPPGRTTTPTPNVTPQPAPIPTPAPYATRMPHSVSAAPALPHVQGSWIARGLRWLRTLREARQASAVSFHELESGHLSIRVSPQIPTGRRIPLRQRFGFLGTRYNPSTVREITALGRIRSVFSRGNLGVGLATSVLGNLYDYTLGEHRGEGFGKEFWVSTGVDFVMTVGTGLTAATVVAGGVVLFGSAGVSLPLSAAVVGTAIAGAGISAILDHFQAGQRLKQAVSNGLDA